MSTQDTQNLPECRMLFRSKDGVELYTVPSTHSNKQHSKERKWLMKGSATLQVATPDGKSVYIQKSGVGVVKCNLEGNHQDSDTATPFLKDSTRVALVTVSPLGNFVLTWEKLSPDSPQDPNLKVWDGITGEYLYGFVQKVVKREGWPYIKWTYDEKYAFMMVTNEIRVYDGNAFQNKENARFTDKMRVPGISAFSVPDQASADAPCLVTSFVPKSKDRPARMSLHKYPATAPVSPKATTYPTVVSKSNNQVEEVVVHWSPNGDSALVSMQTTVDTSGESYYGSTTLNLFLSQGATDAVHVPLPNNSSGPVLDVAWMPNPNRPPCFAVISGRMPAMASLHHGVTAEPLCLFGNAHRNTIAWSNHGRFLCLGGFGNLAGGMTFWDKNKLKPIPQYETGTGKPIPIPDLKASCTVGYGWSPDSRTFFSSTTSPRMNVDNGVKLFRYNGEQIQNVPWDNANYGPDRLLEAVFVVPKLSINTYPDRPQSPAPRRAEGTADDATPAAAPVVPAPAAKKPAGRYVPPSARGKGGGGNSLAERMRREKEGNMMGATKVVPKSTAVSIPGGGKKVIPGMTTGGGVEQKSKSALRKERERKAKAKKAEEEARKKAEEEAAAAAAAAAAATDPQKQAKKIKKTLRQIEDLKAKDPASLNDDQKKKIASEAELLKNLAKLGV
mmetsp:Transcript_26142/g.36860  ORF Transcript_26142/g.36860 Transcript_26142/m.36860 type:complete len:671 (-) Transcript_26142:1690-3702(-)